MGVGGPEAGCGQGHPGVTSMAKRAQKAQASLPPPLMKVIEVRLVVASDGMTTEDLLLEIGMHPSAEVYGVTELQSDGFGHLLPRGFAEVFLDEPQAAEVQRALETGEVS